MIQSITINDFLKLKGKLNIIDIRTIERYNNNHIENAINIPFEKLLLNPHNYLNKENKYYLYCQKGSTSYNACQILSKMGYNVVNISGGYESWIMSKN